MATPKYGLEPIPRDLDSFLKTLSLHPSQTPLTPQQIALTSLPIPTTPLATSIATYAQTHLPCKTHLHSTRVYLLGLALLHSHPKTLAPHFPSTLADPITYYLSSLLHDIGTTDENISSTLLSFEYAGGILARDVVLEKGGEKGVAESCCETIIRHQDVGRRGFVSANTALIHFATLLDNTGTNRHLLHPATLQELYRAYPPDGWSSCFIDVIHKECQLKPYCSTTRLGEAQFASDVEANPLDQE